MNPIADFARGVGRSAAGIIDDRFGYKNHAFYENKVYDSDGNLVSKRIEEIHTNGAINDSRFPRNLNEELMLQEAVGKGDVARKLKLKDDAYQGMQKIHYERPFPDGPIRVHYIKDPNTGHMMDFKIVP